MRRKFFFFFRVIDEAITSIFLLCLFNYTMATSTDSKVPESTLQLCSVEGGKDLLREYTGLLESEIESHVECIVSRTDTHFCTKLLKVITEGKGVTCCTLPVY